MKIHPVGAELIHALGRTDGRTDMPKLIVAFHNFANAPKNDSNISCEPDAAFTPCTNAAFF